MDTLEYKLRQMKLEIAAEFGLHDYDSMDKGELSARTNGKIGGEMTKRLIEIGKQQLILESQRELVPIFVNREEKVEKKLMLPLPDYEELIASPRYYNQGVNSYYS